MLISCAPYLGTSPCPVLPDNNSFRWFCPQPTLQICLDEQIRGKGHIFQIMIILLGYIISSVRSSYSHPDLLVTHQPLFQITPVLNTGLSLSEPRQLYKGYNAIQRQSLDSYAGYMYTLQVLHDIAR